MEADLVDDATEKKSRRPWRTPRSEAVGLITVAVLVVSLMLGRSGAGITDDDVKLFWQLIDLRDLAENPVSAVWNLHTQPPLYNLAVGLIAWSGLPVGPTLFVAFMVCLWIAAVLLADLLGRWGVPPLVAAVIAIVGVCSPSLLWTVGIASYEVPVAMLLVAAAWTFQRHMELGTPRSFASLALVLTLGGLTRSLLSPLWIVVVLSLAAVARPMRVRQLVAPLLIPFLLIGGVMVKNQVMFDSFTTSSWFGFNLQRGIAAPLDRGVVATDEAAGRVSAIALQAPFLPFEAYEAGGGSTCEPGEGHPAITRVAKERIGSIQSSNFNNRCYIEIYKQAQSDSLTLAREHPVDYLSSRWFGLALTFATYPIGYDDPSMNAAGQVEPSQTLLDVVYSPLLANTSATIDTSGWNLSPFPSGDFPYEFSITMLLLTVGFGVVVAAAGWRILGVRNGPRSDWASGDVTKVMIGASFLLIVITGVFIELAENGRFRAVFDPFLFALPLAALFAGVRSIFSTSPPTGEADGARSETVL